MLRQEKKIITDTKEVVQVLIDHYINKVQRSCGQKPTSVAKQSYLIDDIKIVDNVIRHYKDHLSARQIKKNVNSVSPPSVSSPPPSTNKKKFG